MTLTVRKVLRRSRGFVGRSIWVVVAIVLMQLTASVAFYSAIDRQTLREDHARRIAELLVVGERVSKLGQADFDQVMSSHYLQAEVVALPPEGPPTTRAQSSEADAIADYVQRWEPALANRPLRLWSESRPEAAATWWASWP